MKSQKPTGNGLSRVASCAPQTSSSKAETGLQTVTLGLPRPGGELQIIQSHAPEYQLMVARAREEETHKLTKTQQAQSVHPNRRACTPGCATKMSWKCLHTWPSHTNAHKCSPHTPHTPRYTDIYAHTPTEAHPSHTNTLRHSVL